MDTLGYAVVDRELPTRNRCERSEVIPDKTHQIIEHEFHIHDAVFRDRNLCHQKETFDQLGDLFFAFDIQIDVIHLIFGFVVQDQRLQFLIGNGTIIDQTLSKEEKVRDLCL